MCASPITFARRAVLVWPATGLILGIATNVTSPARIAAQEFAEPLAAVIGPVEYAPGATYAPGSVVRGPDGNLYLTGHDPAEAYVMALPEFGSILTWKATVPVANRGQGIAFDHSDEGILFAIIRGEGEEENKVTVNRILFEDDAAKAGNEGATAGSAN